ncbi:hypothetical protein [Dactylosporangium darangshiense]|uniref:Uncharacterized protein n=1 Tax=Dactylosporangium darangshiense TaxID=579108 RepID=A0ABP8DUV8_9ACTN
MLIASKDQVELRSGPTAGATLVGAVRLLVSRRAALRLGRPDSLTVATSPEEPARPAAALCGVRRPGAADRARLAYREVTGPVLQYVDELCGSAPRDVVAAYIPEYVVAAGGRTCYTTRAQCG